MKKHTWLKFYLNQTLDFKVMIVDFTFQFFILSSTLIFCLLPFRFVGFCFILEIYRDNNNNNNNNNNNMLYNIKLNIRITL